MKRPTQYFPSVTISGLIAVLLFTQTAFTQTAIAQNLTTQDATGAGRKRRPAIAG